MKMARRYAVVLFKDGLQLVSYNWLIGKNECFWPPFKSSKLLQKAICECMEPDPERWETIKVIRIFATASK